jgi:hypothetical protein
VCRPKTGELGQRLGGAASKRSCLKCLWGRSDPAQPAPLRTTETASQQAEWAAEFLAPFWEASARLAEVKQTLKSHKDATPWAGVWMAAGYPRVGLRNGMSDRPQQDNYRIAIGTSGTTLGDISGA